MYARRLPTKCHVYFLRERLLISNYADLIDLLSKLEVYWTLRFDKLFTGEKREEVSSIVLWLFDAVKYLGDKGEGPLVVERSAFTGLDQHLTQHAISTLRVKESSAYHMLLRTKLYAHPQRLLPHE
ncbi:hypothetical protein ACU8KH_03219 [Lachancea thermotolerans]